MQIYIIAAITLNKVLGLNGKMPWHLPNDLKFFKKCTQGHCIIMGRKTFESFGNNQPLPNRTNIVLSSKKINVPNVFTANSLQNAIQIAHQQQINTCFVIGGQKLFAEAIPIADKIYLTIINDKGLIQGDTFFPTFNKNNNWFLSQYEQHLKDERHAFDYSFTVWTKDENNAIKNTLNNDEKKIFD